MSIPVDPPDWEPTQEEWEAFKKTSPVFNPENVPIYTVSNKEDMVESRVFSRYDGQFSVSLVDLDSGMTFPLIKIFPLFSSAMAYADSLVKGNVLRIRKDGTPCS